MLTAKSSAEIGDWFCRKIRISQKLFTGILKLVLSVLIAHAPLLPCCHLAHADDSRLAEEPNVVVILADDQGWGDFSMNGNVNLSTPNIDALAREGAKFDRFYVCPVCSPTRAEFLTGRYHPRGGVYSRIIAKIDQPHDPPVIGAKEDRVKGQESYVKIFARSNSERCIWRKGAAH